MVRYSLSSGGGHLSGGAHTTSRREGVVGWGGRLAGGLHEGAKVRQDGRQPLVLHVRHSHFGGLLLYTYRHSPVVIIRGVGDKRCRESRTNRVVGWWPKSIDEQATNSVGIGDERCCLFVALLPVVAHVCPFFQCEGSLVDEENPNPLTLALASRPQP